MGQELEGAGPFVVLLVDDEPQVLRLLRLFLLKEGIDQILTAANGEEALEISRTFPDRIDLLITDIDMGGMSGIDLYRKVHEERPVTRALFISGKAEGFRKSLPEAALLEKPFPLTRFVATVREVLRRR